MNLLMVSSNFLIKSKTRVRWRRNVLIKLMLIVQEPFQNWEYIVTKRLRLLNFLMLFIQVCLQSREYKNVRNLLCFFLHNINYSSIFSWKCILELFDKRKKVLPNESSSLYFANYKIDDLIIDDPSIFGFGFTLIF